MAFWSLLSYSYLRSAYPLHLSVLLLISNIPDFWMSLYPAPKANKLLEVCLFGRSQRRARSVRRLNGMPISETDVCQSERHREASRSTALCPSKIMAFLPLAVPHLDSTEPCQDNKHSIESGSRLCKIHLSQSLSDKGRWYSVL